MVSIAESVPAPLQLPALRQMFEARKRVFVDLLKWDVPVLDGRFEIDQFDNEHATYLIIPAGDGGHAGSARLLKTERPHLLDTLFPDLCAGPPPRGAGILEITRFCLGRDQGARERLETRNHLVSGLVRYALENGVEAYTGVAELALAAANPGIRLALQAARPAAPGRRQDAWRAPDRDRRGHPVTARGERHLPARAAPAARASRGLKGEIEHVM